MDMYEHEFINLEEEIHKHDFPHKQSFELKSFAYMIVRKITRRKQIMLRDMNS